MTMVCRWPGPGDLECNADDETDREPAGYGNYSGVSGGGPHQAPQQMESYGYDRLARPEPVAVATPPAVPTFGFSLPGQPGYR